MLHMLNLKDYKSIQKDGAAKTHISVFQQNVLSRESYKLTQTKMFDMQWSSVVKGQSETLACMLTMGLQ